MQGALLWAYGLLWTALPAFIVSLFARFFAKTLDALQECQPTIELRKHAIASFWSGNRAKLVCRLFSKKDRYTRTQDIQQKSTAKLTLLLDYGSHWFPLTDAFHAYRNKHFLIGTCMIVRWAFVLTGPLAAAIISIGNVPSTIPMEVSYSTFFDDVRNESSSRSSLDSASAILINGGSPYPWTTNTTSVVPFFASSGSTGNLTATTRTYSASLDCTSINIDSLINAGNVTLYDDGLTYTEFHFADRGCSINTSILATPHPPLLSYTGFSQCPLEADQGRLLLMTGNYDPESAYRLSNFSLISCIPFFWKATSQVSVVSGDNNLGQAGRITEIITNSSTIERFWPQFWNFWMYEIPQYKVIDPAQSIDSDDFGKLVYNYAMQSNSKADFVQAMNTSFSTLFAIFATTSTYSPMAQITTSTGTLSRPVNRLFVVLVPATVVTIVMAISLIVSIWIAIYSHINRPILQEHLKSILGHAILLEGNEGVQNFIKVAQEGAEMQATKCATKKPRQETEREVVDECDLVKYVKETPSLREWNCWVEDDGKLWLKQPDPVVNNPNTAVPKKCN
jgi:hypothetical protein